MFFVWTLAVLISAIFYFAVRSKQTYWSRIGVKQRKQKFLFGDTYHVLRKMESDTEMLKGIYRAFPEERYVGYYHFTTPMLLIRDPGLIKQILVKDFDHFTDRRDRTGGSDPLWSGSVAQARGKKWRNLRSTLSPAFTSSKMKMLFKLFSGCSEDFCEHFLDKRKPHTVEVELKDIFTRFGNDVIASVVFAVECDSLKEPENEFYLMGRKLSRVFSGFRNYIKYVAYIIFPDLFKFLRIMLLTGPVRSFFTTIVNEGLRRRQVEGLVRHDMMHLLLEARKGKAKHDDNRDDVPDTGFSVVQESTIHANRKSFAKEEITDLDIAANLLVFFFAGFHTLSTLLCFMGYELTVNPDVQAKLQKEIDETLRNGGLTYEALVKMKYLDMVVSEVLRKWSPSVTLDRECVKPYTIRPSKPGEKPVHLKVNDKIVVGIATLHRDPKYFPRPDVFDPERFNDENKETIEPYTYNPFGTGPRNCIGSRFAILEVKTLFFHLLSKFDLVVVNRTQIPLQVNRGSHTVEAENGFWTGLRPRTSKN